MIVELKDLPDGLLGFSLEGTVVYEPGGNPPFATAPFSLDLGCLFPPPCYGYGACCIYLGGGNHGCVYTTETGCEAEDGTFLGVGSSCAN